MSNNAFVEILYFQSTGILPFKIFFFHLSAVKVPVFTFNFYPDQCKEENFE